MCLTFSKAIIIINFKIHQPYIAKYLCVNRDRPQMHCNGKCFLRKKLREEEQQSKNTNTSRDKIDAYYFEEPAYQYHFIPEKLTTIPDTYRVAGYCSPVFSFFHPPRAVVG